MYGKIFREMYNGTLVQNWQALITFQQLIVLSDADGVIDYTTEAIASRTGIPIEIIQQGIRALESEDPYSRSPDENGRRIVLLDEHRPWGWVIVNHKKYRDMPDADRVRKQNRLRQQRKRLRDHGLDERSSCEYCGADATGVDHLIPKSKGGTDEPENLVAACSKCNQHKATRTVSEFIFDEHVTNTNKDICVAFSNENEEHTPVKTPKLKPAHEMVIDLYHQILPERPKVAKGCWPGSTREKHLSDRLKAKTNYQTEEFWQLFFETVRVNDWWMGRDPKWKGVNLAWLVQRNNFDKVIEQALNS